MANKLKSSDDPIAKAQRSETHFEGTAKKITVYPRRASEPDACDGYCGDSFDDKSPRLWAPVNPAAKPNTYSRESALRDLRQMSPYQGDEGDLIGKGTPGKCLPKFSPCTTGKKIL